MRPSQVRNLVVLVVVVVLGFWGLSVAADFVIEYNWWKEVGQVDTWVSMLWYSIAPAAEARWWPSSRCRWRTRAGWTSPASGERDYPLYSRLVPVGWRSWRCCSLGLDRLLDGDALFRLARAGAAPPMPGRTPFFRTAAVLSFRSAFLFPGAWLCVCAGDSLRACSFGSRPGDGSCRTLRCGRLPRGAD